MTLFAVNQRDEVRDLDGAAGALQARPGMRQQTFVASEPCLNSWDTQHNRIFTEQGVSPTLSGANEGKSCGGLMFAGFSAGAGARAASIGYHEEESPTLNAGSGGNRTPAVLCLNDQGGERMDVCEDVSGTLRAQAKHHLPLVFENNGESYCIAGNTIGREDQNGGNGTGIQSELAYTLTGADRR